jgi:5'-nucleotidase
MLLLGKRGLKAILLGYSLEGKLVVGISSRALFNLDQANSIFEKEGLAAYRSFQRANEKLPLEPGTGFALVRGLLSINKRVDERLIEVIIVSRNHPDSGLRIFNSIEAHGLDITRAAFSGGKDPWPYLQPFCCKLFLSAEPTAVVAALGAGFPAALVCPPPDHVHEDVEEVRIAFDGDAVLFEDEADKVFQGSGVDAFLQRELDLADQPMNPGPFEPFLRALKLVQDRFPEDEAPIQTALVTARQAPSHKRIFNTLRHWGIRIDQCFFLGGIQKADVLEVLQPHIYFDDELAHLQSAQVRTPSAHVLPPPSQAADLEPSEHEALNREEGKWWINRIKADLKSEERRVERGALVEPPVKISRSAEDLTKAQRVVVRDKDDS